MSSWRFIDYPLQQLFTSGALNPTTMLRRLKLSPVQELALRQVCIEERAGRATIAASLGGASGRRAWQLLRVRRSLMLRVVELPGDLLSVNGDQRLDLMEMAVDELQFLPVARNELLRELVRVAPEAERPDVDAYARSCGFAP